MVPKVKEIVELPAKHMVAWATELYKLVSISGSAWGCELFFNKPIMSLVVLNSEGKIMFYRVHEDEYGKVEVPGESSKNICDLELLDNVNIEVTKVLCTVKVRNKIVGCLEISCSIDSDCWWKSRGNYVISGHLIEARPAILEWYLITVLHALNADRNYNDEVSWILGNFVSILSCPVIT